MQYLFWFFFLVLLSRTPFFPWPQNVISRLIKRMQGSEKKWLLFLEDSYLLLIYACHVTLLMNHFNPFGVITLKHDFALPLINSFDCNLFSMMCTCNFLVSSGESDRCLSRFLITLPAASSSYSWLDSSVKHDLQVFSGGGRRSWRETKTTFTRKTTTRVNIPSK